MKLLIAVGWLLVILVALNIAIAHAQGEATPTVSPVAREQSTEEITSEPLTSTWTPSPTFTSVPEATPTATATASWTPIPINTEVTPEAMTPTSTLEVLASETTSALTTTPSTTATFETQNAPTIGVTVSPTPSSTALLPSATSVANTPTLTPTEEVAPSISPTSVSQPSPTLEVSTSPTLQPTEMTTTTSTVSPVTASPSPTAIPSVSPLDLNFYIKSALDPVVLGETFEFRLMASETFNTTGLETAGICAYDGNFLSFPDGSTPETGTWHFRIAADLNADNAALATTNVTAMAIGQSTVTCVLQGVDGEETISSFQAVDVQVIAPLQLSVTVSTYSLQPISFLLLDDAGNILESQTITEDNVLFDNLLPGIYIVQIAQPEYLSAITEVAIADSSLNITCNLVFGDLDRDNDVDAEDLAILQSTYRSLPDLRLLAANLYLSDDNTSCFVETLAQTSTTTSNN